MVVRICINMDNSKYYLEVNKLKQFRMIKNTKIYLKTIIASVCSRKQKTRNRNLSHKINRNTVHYKTSYAIHFRNKKQITKQHPAARENVHITHWIESVSPSSAQKTSRKFSWESHLQVNNYYILLHPTIPPSITWNIASSLHPGTKQTSESSSHGKAWPRPNRAVKPNPTNLAWAEKSNYFKLETICNDVQKLLHSHSQCSRQKCPWRQTSHYMKRGGPVW